MKVRFGIIGVGDFGVLHIQVLRQNPEAEIVAVCCRTESRLKKICQEYGIPKYYTDAGELVRDEEIDAVVIATGEDTHYCYTEKAIHAGKHVLLEKPICLTAEDAARIVDLDKSTDLHILPGHILRHDAAYNSAYATLRDKSKAGTIQSIRVKRNVPIERFSLHSRTHPVFMALAHDIDIITWLADSEVKRVFGMKVHTAEGCSSPDIVFGVAELENGILCSLETQWRLPNEYGQYLDTELEVMTTKGNLKLNCPGTSLSYMFDGHLSRPDVTLWPEINGKLTGALVNEDQHMIDLVLGRTDMQVVTVEEAVRGIEFCRMLIESCDTGKVIDRSGL